MVSNKNPSFQWRAVHFHQHDCTATKAMDIVYLQTTA